MARTVAIFLGVWVAISIPTGIVLGRLIATASRLPRSGPRLEAERRGSRAASCRHSIEPTRLAGRRLAVLRGEAVSPMPRVSHDDAPARSGLHGLVDDIVGGAPP